MNSLAARLRSFVLRQDSRLAAAGRPPRWLRVLAVWLSRPADFSLWLVVAVVGGLAGHDLKRSLLAVGLALGNSQAVMLWLKRRIRRPRPVRPDWSTFGPWRFDQFSFPSGHSATSFAVAVSVGGLARVLLPPLLLLAVAVAASRVILRLHWLSDVLAGSVLGLGTGGLALWLVR